MSWYLTNLLDNLLLPPFNLLLVGLTGLLLWYKHPPVSRVLIAMSLILMWLCCTPYAAEGLVHQLETTPPLASKPEKQAEAIVVLGGGSYFHAPEYGTDTVSKATLVRLRYAATLYRETGKPILTSGGRPLSNSIPEARQMKDVLEHEFNVPVQWTEDNSSNTFENARLSYQILAPLGIKHIYLVTHAWHMPRAVMAFQQAGFDVVPAPTAYTTRFRTGLLAFIPNAEALRQTRIFLHELVGSMWYEVRPDD